jgi:glycine/D-amino acid oxidase-like deaminating enzyme
LAEVVVIGGGIVGCALAAFLAEGGASVTLHEREAIAAGASGRNSGIVQHPMDTVLAPLFHETVEHYRDLAPFGFALPAEPSGLLVLGTDEDVLDAELAAVGGGFPELGAERLAPGEPHALEPVVAPGLAGLWMATGYAVPPAEATLAFARRAEAAGARIVIGSAATPADVRADAVVIAAGPWTPSLVDPGGAWRPITALWGVNVEVHLPEPPRHALEEAGIDALLAAGGGEDGLFALVTAGRVSALGATFLADEPDAAARAPRLQARGARFVPVLGSAPIVSVRACARPRSADGRPLLGRRGDLVVASGHGAWGISLGPASARLVADLVLGRVPAIPPELDAARFDA